VGIYSDLVAKLGSHFASLVAPVSNNKTAIPDQDASDNFKNIVERSILGVIVNRIDRSPLYANKRCADLFGYDSPEEILKLENTLQLATKTDAARIAEARDNERSAETNVNMFEFNGLRKDGSVIPLYAKSATTTWQGQIARVTTFIELASVKEAELKHAESEERFRQFATISSDWFWELDRNLKATYISGDFDTDGAPLPKDLTNNSPKAVYKGLEKHPTYDAFIEKLDNHEDVTSHNIFRCKKGQKGLWLQINAQPMFDAQKKFTGYRGTTVDVTQSVEAAEALSATEERFNRSTRGAKVTIWDWHMETDEYYVSGEAARLYGYTDENMPHSREAWNKLVHPEDMEGYSARFLAHIKGETDVFEYEYRLQRADGNYSRVAVQGSAQRDAMGKAIRVSGWGIDITEQRNTEILLAEAINSLSEGFALYNAEDKLIAYNQQYAGMFTDLGVTTQIGQTFEANARNVLKLRAQREGKDLDKQDLNNMLGNHRDPPPYIERQIHDGRWIRTTEVKTPSGSVAGLRTDITQYRNLLDQLAKSEERFRAFAEVASDWYFEMDKDLKFTFISDGIQRTRKMDQKDFIGKTHEEVFAKFTDHYTHQGFLEDLKKQLPKRDILLRRKESDLITRWALVNIIPKFDEVGTFDGYYGAGHDVTNQMQAQQALEHKEAQVSGMLEIAPDAIIAIGQDQKVQIFNQGATKLFGYQEIEVIGRSLDILIPGRFHQIHARHIDTFENSGVTSRRMGDRGEITGLKKDGSEFPAEASVSRLRQGNDTLYTIMLHDISERKVTEGIVQKSMEEAQYANRAKSEFLANMSHELRTPLNAILGFSEALKVGIQGPLSVNQSEYIDAVSQSGEHLLSLINDILDLSKLEAGKADVEEEDLDMDRLIDQAFLLVGERAREGEIGLGLAPEHDSIHLRGDKRMVLQIMLNLLSNAVKFTLPGGAVTVNVAVTGEENVELSIMDTGIGMTPIDIPRALSTFGQLDGDLDRRHEGTGLGLPLVKSLAELHGGKLVLTSEPGVGTNAMIIFPIVRLIEIV
jgi:PAS domain S-box-containing protein